MQGVGLIYGKNSFKKVQSKKAQGMGLQAFRPSLSGYVYNVKVNGKFGKVGSLEECAAPVSVGKKV